MAKWGRGITLKSNWEKIWEDLFEVNPLAVVPTGNNTKKVYNVEISEFERIKSILRYLVTIGAKRNPGIARKNETSAQKYRNSAKNFLFIPEIYSIENSIEHYTKMIAHSPLESHLLVLGFANRSAVLCKVLLISDCLLDINRAFNIGFPDGLKAQLYYRITKCYEGQKVSKFKMQEAVTNMRLWMERMAAPDREELEQLIEKEKNNSYSDDSPFFRWNNDKVRPRMFGENPMIPGLSSSIHLEHDVIYGRHMVAAIDIHPGEILAIQKPYARIPHWMMRYKICWDCGRQTWSGVPCHDCADVIFCSETCRDKANLEYHDLECPLVRVMSNLNLSDKLFMALRLFIKGYKEMGNSVRRLKNLVEEIDAQRDPLFRGFTDNIMDPTTFSTIYGLTKNDGDDKYSCHSILVAYLFATRTHIFGKGINASTGILKFNRDFIFVSRLIEKLYRLSKCNTSEDVLLDGNDKLIRTSHSLVPAHCFFNHQCYPSACASYHGDFRVAKSLTYIKKGQQIFFTYAQNDHHLKTVTARRRDLFQQFKFHCDCRACSWDWPMIPDRKSPPNSDTEGQVTSTGIDLREKLPEFDEICISQTENYYFGRTVQQPDVTAYITQLREIIETLSREVSPGNWYLISAQLYLKKFMGLLENRFIVVDQYD